MHLIPSALANKLKITRYKQDNISTLVVADGSSADAAMASAKTLDTCSIAGSELHMTTVGPKPCPAPWSGSRNVSATLRLSTRCSWAPKQPERFNRSWLRADMKLRGTGASHGGVSAYHLTIWSLIRHSWNGTV